MLLTLGCKENKVTITKDYVINPNWSETDNYFRITRMHTSGSGKTIDLKEPTEAELYHGLIEDTGFSYTANVKYNGEDYTKRKIYFNRDNGFVWRKPPDIDISRNITFKTIGELQQDTWYLLAGLSQFKILYYVYLDTSDSLHMFKISTMTNY